MSDSAIEDFASIRKRLEEIEREKSKVEPDTAPCELAWGQYMAPDFDGA